MAWHSERVPQMGRIQYPQSPLKKAISRVVPLTYTGSPRCKFSLFKRTFPETKKLTERHTQVAIRFVS